MAKIDEAMRYRRHFTSYWYKTFTRNNFVKEWCPSKIVQERLGHSSIVMTMDTYSHVINGMGKAAAAGFDDAVINYKDDKAVEKVTV